jgi:LPS-assembly lipoprotein
MRGGPARIAAAVLAAAVLLGLSACDRLDFLIVRAVREQAGSGSSPYRIALRTATRERGLGRAGDGRATRFALQVTVRYTLTRTDGVDEPAITGMVRERILFEAPNDPFALISARSQAEQRAAETLGLSVIRDASIAISRAREPRLNP